MAKIFLTLSVIASLIAGGLGYLTWQKITDVKSTLKVTIKDRDDKAATLQKTQFTLKDTQDTLATTKTALDTANETINTDKSTIDGLNQKVTASQASIDDLTTKLAAANDTITAMKGPSNKPGEEGKSVVEQKIEDLTNQLNEAKQLNVTLQAKADEAVKHADELTKKELAHQQSLNRPGLEGTVMAVNPGYGFAVISIGDHQGAVANAQVLVKRGDVLIAKLKITTVEPVTSVADILPDTVAKGQRVLPGDRVIFTGQTAQ